ncbi:outer membrane protein OmpA-like peptidoglycan-associated protein [Rhodovulum bhavnagarense]|uniref:Outer membrane protein OmpA-like peptidoglycan-associated protein n=1 Tax=Rhodovulum bhavnagarense TaxID=992286 RepID=A0A4R2RKS7_9RHOB|nr:OmpA family protein [Rhodovulum bhavnagarense]TCP62807.1 outer membrane protein OmpA-like peptidoglycan-associated protein [Rhodovulum bhavnagarense]
MTRVPRILLLASAGLLALSACTDPSANTGDPRQRTKEGMAIGAGLGALTGLLLSKEGGDDAKNAVIGAVGGAIAGGVIGNALDQQAADLRQGFDNDDINVVNTGSELVVTMPQDILFATDSAAVRPDLRSDLMVLAANLNKYPASTVDVIGHTDNTGAAGYNQDLSARRAAAVSAVLTGSGVAPSRIRSYGRGEDAPIASNLTPEGRAQNRRVEIVIRPTA